MNSHLSPPGTASYTSDTLHVGDGTWDSARDDFLLPNIQALNFDTMRYNGMGNRFRDLPEYHTLITGHGVLAAITFLFMVPAAIFIARFYHRNPRLALRIHIGLNVLTVLLATVVIVLGYFAVGPVRSLSNPHHGIGIAIYVLVLIQAFGGWIIHRIERGKVRYYLPLKVMLHEWVGRSIALLALAQIPIGLTLYGSPSFLFVLYSLVMAAYLALYFILTYTKNKNAARGVDERGSYVSGTHTESSARRSDHHHSRLGALGAAIAGGAGIEALRRRYRSRDRAGSRERGGSQTDVVASERGSRTERTESYLDEKYTEDDRSRAGWTWRDRLLGGAAGLGGLATLRRFMDRGRGPQGESDVGSYRPPPPGGAAPRGFVENHSEMDFDRLEEGRTSAVQDDYWRQVEAREAAQEAEMPRSDLRPRASRGTLGTYDSRPSRQESERTWGFGRFASFGGFRDWFRRRKERKEQQHVESERQREYENERMFQRGEQQPLYQAADTPTRGTEHTGAPSGTPGGHFEGSPANRGDMLSLNDPGGTRPSQVSFGQPQSIPPPPGPPRDNMLSRGAPRSSRDVAPPPPAHQDIRSSPGTASFTGAEGQRSQMGAGSPRGASVNRGARGDSITSPPPVASPGRNRDLGDGVDSPPVSVKVKMHNDGRHVTLRRLSEEEASVERESRRANQRGRPVDSGLSDLGEGVTQTFRRRDQTPLPPRGAEATPSQQTSELHLPPAQQQPAISPPSALGGSGMGGYETGDSNYDVNRRRRRAERSRAQAARHERMAGGGSTGKVEFV